MNIPWNFGPVPQCGISVFGTSAEASIQLAIQDRGPKGCVGAMVMVDRA